MKIIKLDAINSTNEYLKNYIQNNSIINTHAVYTFNQTKGKGQRGKVWLSEPEKNLAFSICFFPKSLKVNNQFNLNMTISLFLLNTLKSLKIPNLKIKWPNDILSGEKKICGILNEIKVKGNIIDNIIMGFGINVNQENFENLPNASSLKLIKNINYDLNGLVSLITQNLNNYNYLNPKSESEIKSLTLNYNKNLYGTNAFNDFSDLNNNSFKGKVISVDRKGVIKVQKKDNSFHNFNFHEIQMIFN
jgi:BirA family biotin operon repressor/biotin-[acetyl-CoA-carboxylase] ligase|tara:strand:+ start:449 stop:1189 length:741 start_codon:yes stop_codon:yes gene_type:complete